MTSFRSELCLLLLCARNCNSAEETSQRQHLLSQDLDWPYLLRSARAHRVMPLLYRCLNSTSPQEVPKAVLEQLREHFYANAGRNLFVAKELFKILHLLEQNGIRAIPYKGPVLAASVYGNLAFREFSDLDILVRERDYSKAQRLFTDRGFRRTIEHDWETEFVDAGARFAVDLHNRMVCRDFPATLTFEYLSRQLEPVELAGGVTSTLCPQDTLLMLSIQVTKDSHLQLFRLCDIAELLRVNQELNWSRVIDAAKRLRMRRRLANAIHVTSDFLGTALPQQLACEKSFHPYISGLLAQARQQIFHLDNCAHDANQAEYFRWLQEERLRDKLCRYLRDLLVPCELDRLLLPLPNELSLLYYFIRPVRLMGKHGSRHLSTACRKLRSLH